MIGGAAFNFSDHRGPAPFTLSMKSDNFKVFLNGPLLFHDTLIQMVHPALTALFRDTSRQLGGNFGPVFGAIFIDKASDHIIFSLCPNSARAETLIAELEVALLTVHLGSAQLLTDDVPDVLLSFFIETFFGSSFKFFHLFKNDRVLI